MIDAFYMFFILHLRNDSTIPPISSKIPAPRPGWRTDPNGFCYSAAITSCEKAVQWHQALQLYERMAVSTVPADVVSFSALMSSLGKLGKWKVGEFRKGECGWG
jgi:hypothetical protein